jgi:hypothetical protein
MLRRIIRPKNAKSCRAGPGDDGDEGGDDDDAGAGNPESLPIQIFSKTQQPIPIPRQIRRQIPIRMQILTDSDADPDADPDSDADSD